MNRRSFIAAFAALFAAPFIKREPALTRQQARALRLAAAYGMRPPYRIYSTQTIGVTIANSKAVARARFV